jgi:ABC-type lipoprotein export system ATPase subunit
MSLVRARRLVKTFGEGRGARRVLQGVDLDVAAGELVVVIGPSGSGKSTLLHLLGGLDRPDEGAIEVAGRRLEREGERGLAELRRQDVGFVFQFFHLVPELTAEENLLLPARLAGPSDDGVQRGSRLLDALGLRAVADRLPHTLSGGEQQRLAIGRALVNDPALVLADEPTGNLDAETGASVLALLREIAGGGRAVVLVTHDPEAAPIADRVLHFSAGRLVSASR